MQDSIIYICLKLLHGHKDVPESVMGMINHILMTIHEQDKKTHFLNCKKSLKASKATDFPKDFKDFYNKWGVWDKRLKAFANNIPIDKLCSFTASFNIRSEWDPVALLEKISLKMATQTNYKGTILVKMKPCQCLDTVLDIIFFNLPFCNTRGLWDFICWALTKQKSSLIKHHPLKFPRMEWGRHLA